MIPACSSSHGYLVTNQPLDVQQEGHGLLNIGEQKVENEDDELKLDSMFPTIFEKETICEEDKESGGRCKRQYAKGRYGWQPFPKDWGKRGKRSRLGRLRLHRTREVGIVQRTQKFWRNNLIIQ